MTRQSSGARTASRFGWRAVWPVLLVLHTLAVATPAGAQTVEATTAAPRTVTMRVLQIETGVDSMWDRWWARRVAFELADAEFELAALRDRRPADPADRDRIRARVRDVQSEVARLRPLAVSAERQVRTGQVLLHGWDGVSASEITVIAERSRVEEAAKLPEGVLVDVTIETVTRKYPHPNPRNALERHSSTRTTEHSVRTIRTRRDPPPDWREPSERNPPRVPLVAIDPERVQARVVQRRSPVQRPYLAVTVDAGILTPLRWARIRAIVREEDGQPERELTPPGGLLVRVPQLTGRSTLEMVVDWPVHDADRIRVEVLEAWRRRR